ncbi:MAG: hypothetical protein ACRDBM_04370 [Sporomusa sp.]
MSTAVRLVYCTVDIQQNITAYFAICRVVVSRRSHRYVSLLRLAADKIISAVSLKINGTVH